MNEKSRNIAQSEFAPGATVPARGEKRRATARGGCVEQLDELGLAPSATRQDGNVSLAYIELGATGTYRGEG